LTFSSSYTENNFFMLHHNNEKKKKTKSNSRVFTLGRRTWQRRPT